MKIKTYKDFLNYTNEFILKQNFKKKFPGKKGIKRMKFFANVLGNPQENLQVIHVAGTSGKGSTAFLISQALISQNFKVGLHLSPHLLDIRERFLINDKFLSKRKVIDYFNEILPKIEQIKSQKKQNIPSYFELFMGFALYIFQKENVDYVVLETGLGGKYDASNVVEKKDKVCVLTKIDFDHTHVLGDTKEEIAIQKMGIVYKNNLIISVNQNKSVNNLIKKIAKEKHAYLNFVYDFPKLDYLSLKGKFQNENAALALEVFKKISKKDKFKIDWKNLRQKYSNLRFLGRFDVLKNMGIVLDGAHNPHKMANLIDSLKVYYQNQKFVFLIAFKSNKDFEKMLDLIMPIAKKIIISKFNLKKDKNQWQAQDPLKIQKYLQSKNYLGKIELADNLSRLEKVLLKQLNKDNKFDKDTVEDDEKEEVEGKVKEEVQDKVQVDSQSPDLVITGSLYFLSEIYEILSL